MEELFKGFFGEDGSASIDYSTFVEALNKSGMKLADINRGEYVAKAKYDRAVNEYTQYKAENDPSKYADYDTMKAENEQLKAEKAESAMLKVITGKNVDERFARFVMSEVRAELGEDGDFEKALDDYIKNNPQFLINPKNDKTKNVVKIGSSGELEKGSGRTQNSAEKMNKIIRGVK